MPPLFFEYNLLVGRRLLLPKLSDVIFVTVFLAAVMLGPRVLNTDGDLGRDLTLGKVILSSHVVPTTDILSWTKMGEPRPPYEWVAQVLLAAAYHLGALDAVVLLVAAIIAASFAIVFADALGRSELPITSLIMSSWAAVASSLHWLARPHVFSFLFFAIWLWGLERLRTNPRTRLWTLPALMLVWANTHGGFVFGFAAWAAYCAGWLWQYRSGGADPSVAKRLVITGVLSLIASVATPDLWGNWQAVLANRSSYILRQTAETMPPQIVMPGVWPFLFLLALALLLAILNARRARAEHVVLLAGLAMASLLMARNIPLFAIAAAPIAARWVAELLEAVRSVPSWESAFAKLQTPLMGLLWPTVAMLVAAAALIIHGNATKTSVFGFKSQVFPVMAVDWIQANRPRGAMFNDLNWGGYLLYRLWPDQRVYIDSQTDFYGEQFVRQYANVLAAGPGWEGELGDAEVGWAIIPPDSPLAKQLAQDDQWVEPYKDSTAAVFVRAAP